MTRYVVLGDGGYEMLDNARAACGQNERVFILGDEVKEPDYGPLVEWMKGQKSNLRHVGGCYGGPMSCSCGLVDALKAAGIE